MARLIDADALMDEFRRYMVERYDREKCVSEENCKTCEHRCLWQRIVSEATTVDAVEVVHGHWVDLGRNYYTVVSQCSECGAKYDFRSPYCPNCGAKMDEKP